MIYISSGINFNVNQLQDVNYAGVCYENEQYMKILEKNAQFLYLEIDGWF